MSAKTLLITALAGLVATAAHALTSDEIAAALDAKQENGTFTFPKPKDATFFKVIGVRKFK